MANKRVLFLKNNEAMIKIDGAVGAVTISLATDLLGTGEVLTAGGTPTVNISAVVWSSLPSGTFTIARNGVNLYSGSGYGHIGPHAGGGIVENSFNTFDITVTTATAETQVWIRLHKLSGYSPKWEPEQFGSYDNPNAAGS